MQRDFIRIFMGLIGMAPRNVHFVL